MKSLIASVLVFIAALCLFDMPMPVLNGSEIYGIITATVITAVIGFPIGLIVGGIPAIFGGFIGGVIGSMLPDETKTPNRGVNTGAKIALYTIGYPLGILGGAIMYANLYRGIHWFPVFTLAQGILIEIAHLLIHIRMNASKTKE